MERKHIFFRGNVQGVGFRYTALRVAKNYDVTGYVRNMPDGRVEIVAEGPNTEIRSFFQAVTQAMGQYIRATSVLDKPYTGEFEQFQIRH